MWEVGRDLRCVLLSWERSQNWLKLVRLLKYANCAMNIGMDEQGAAITKWGDCRSALYTTQLQLEGPGWRHPELLTRNHQVLDSLLASKVLTKCIGAWPELHLQHQCYFLWGSYICATVSFSSVLTISSSDIQDSMAVRLRDWSSPAIYSEMKTLQFISLKFWG